MTCADSYYCMCCISTDDLSPLVGPGVSYIAILKEIFKVKVSPIEEDTSNCYICGGCAAKLLEADNFKMQMIESFRTLKVKGLIKTRRGKGGYLMVKHISNEISPSESNEYCTEFLDESLLNEALDSPPYIMEFPEDVNEEIVQVEDSFSHYNRINEPEQTKHDLEETKNVIEAVNRSQNTLLEIKASYKNTEHVEHVNKVLDVINVVFEDTKTNKDSQQILVNNKETLQNNEIDNSTENELQDMENVAKDIDIEGGYEKSLNQIQCDVNDIEVMNYSNSILLEGEHVMEDIETAQYSNQIIHFTNSNEEFPKGAQLFFQEAEHSTEVIDQELQDFEHLTNNSPDHFEEIEIDSPNQVKDLEIFMEISNNNEHTVVRLGNEISKNKEQSIVHLGNKTKELDEHSQNLESITVITMENNDQTIDQYELKQTASSEIKAKEKRKDKEQKILHTQSVLLYHDGSVKEKEGSNNFPIKVERKTQLIENRLTPIIPIKDPIEKEKRITVTRTRQKKPKGAKSKEVILYRVNPEFRCEYCSECLPNLRTYHIHMNKHFPYFKCNICGKPFLSEKRLKRHDHSHKKGPFPCTSCSAEFDNYNTMNSHRQRKHRDVMLYKCTECDERFVTFHRRTLHLAESHGHNEKKYRCHHCTKEFMISGNLSAHVRRVHQHVRRHTCDRCGAGFFLKQELQAHMVLHTGVREHRCPVCRKCYPRKRTLDAHLRTHEERRHACDECGRKFVQKVTLQCHLRVHEKRRLLSA